MLVKARVFAIGYQNKEIYGVRELDQCIFIYDVKENMIIFSNLKKRISPMFLLFHNRLRLQLS